MADEQPKANKYYAWSEILYGSGDNTGRTKLGEEVSRQKLGVSEDEWNQLVEGSSVRTEPYPKDMRVGESPTQYYTRKAAEMAGEAT